MNRSDTTGGVKISNPPLSLSVNNPRLPAYTDEAEARHPQHSNSFATPTTSPIRRIISGFTR
ncbi:hypothetical protein EH228_04955 [Erwinia endophytica]|nr:hypothetical protein EH228_04955 [Erwinia endophytica]